MRVPRQDEVDRLRAEGNKFVQETWLGRLTRADVCSMAPSKDDRPVLRNPIAVYCM